MANKSLISALCTSFFAIVMAAMQPAFALSFETDAFRDSDSGTASDPQGPATTGSLLSEVLVPSSDGIDIFFTGSGGYARSAADDTGAGAVGVDGAFYTGPAVNTLTATSILTSEITNTTGGLVPFAYDFFLPGPRLTISDFAGISDASIPTIEVFFDFRVLLDFGSGFGPASVVSQGILTGGTVNHTLGTAGTDQLDSTFFADPAFGGDNIFGYQFDDLAGSVTGFLADGATVGVRSEMFVRLMTPGVEAGGAASIGDPLDLSAGAFSGNLSIVPVPAAVWLFGSGLIGLVGLARRKV